MAGREWFVGVGGLVLFTLLLAWSLRAYGVFRREHPEAAVGFLLLEVASVVVYVVGVVGLLWYLSRARRGGGRRVGDKSGSI